MENIKLVRLFNNEIKEELKSIKIDSQNDSYLINELVAMRFMSFVAIKIGEQPTESEFRNKSKNPLNHFQMEMQCLSGKILWATFVYVENNHIVNPYKTNIELLDNNYNTIKKL